MLLRELWKRKKEFFIVFGYFFLLVSGMIMTHHTFLGIQDEAQLQATLKAADVYNYMTSYPLALFGGWLYTHFPHGQWYSVIMTFYTLFMTLVMSGYIILLDIENRWGRWFIKGLLLALFTLLTVYTLLEVDVTSPTLLLIALAVPLVKRHQVWFWFIFWVASFLREQIIFSVIPLVALAYVIGFDRTYFTNKRKIVLSLLFVAGILFNHFSYKLDKGYAQWMEFTEARAFFTDFNGGYSPVLTPDEYHLAKTWWLLDRELYPVAKIPKAAGSKVDLVKERFLQNHPKWQVRAVLIRHPEIKILFALSLLIALLYRSWLRFGAYALFGIGLIVLLIVKDVERVTFPVLIMWWVLLATDLWRIRGNVWLRRSAVGAVVLIVAWLCYFTYRTLPLDRITHFAQREALHKEFKDIIARNHMQLEITSGYPASWGLLVEALMENHLFDEANWADFYHDLLLSGWFTQSPICYRQHQISADGVKRKYATYYDWLMDPNTGIIGSKGERRHVHPFLATKLMALYDKKHPKKGFRHIPEVVDESKHFIIHRIVQTDAFITRVSPVKDIKQYTPLWRISSASSLRPHHMAWKEGILHATDKDPWFFVTLPHSKSRFVLLDVDIEIPRAHDEMQLFYKTSDKRPYNEIDSVKIRLKKGWNHFQLKIPREYLQRTVRIDPSNYAGEYRVRSIALYPYAEENASMQK